MRTARYTKSYKTKIGTIKYTYNKQESDHVGKLVGNKKGCQISLSTTILILLRDLLKAHTKGLTGCPYEYVEKAGGDIEVAHNMWKEEILRTSQLCDECLKDTFFVSQRTGVPEEKLIEERTQKINEIFDWMKQNLDTLWW